MKNVEMVTHNGCPICIMTKKELEKHSGDINLTIYTDNDSKGDLIVKESNLRSAPILKVDGKFYAGNDALKFAKTL